MVCAVFIPAYESKGLTGQKSAFERANLNVKQDIMEISTSGYMFDARIDEEVFGFTYDFLEFYRYYISYE